MSSELPDMYKVSVLFPIEAGPKFIETMFVKLGEAADDVLAAYDERAARDWDIHCYGTPEKDDLGWPYKNQETLLEALQDLIESIRTGDQDKISAALRNAEEDIENLL